MPAESDAALSAEKKRLRQSASTIRAHLHERHGEVAAWAVAHFGTELFAGIGCEVVSAYYPFRSELDTLPLLVVLGKAGATLCLPVIQAPAQPLIFRRWQPGDPLRDGAYDIQVPDPDAGEVVPTALFVPLLAFDARGYRLGYGGGYYDRTLAALRRTGPIVAIGLGFEGQEVSSIPHNAYDQPMDYIVCESGWRRVGETKDN